MVHPERFERPTPRFVVTNTLFYCDYLGLIVAYATSVS